MRLAIIFPFFRTLDNLTDGPPLSTPLLVGNLRKEFPSMDFEQIDLHQEMKVAVLRKKFSQKKHLRAISDVYQLALPGAPKKVCSAGDLGSAGLVDKQLVGRMGGNRLEMDYYIPSEQDLRPFEKYLNEVVKLLKLDRFDHYFLTVYKANEPDIAAAILLGRFLKKRYPGKKIIFGGLRYFTGNFAQNIDKLKLADSLVVGHGFQGAKEIIRSLSQGQKLEKVYKIPLDLKMKMSAPDYESFRNLDHFRFTQKDLERIFKIKITKKNQEGTLFIPYRFSAGCFWGRCAYCDNSGFRQFRSKSVEQIVSELVQLKKLHRTRFFVFLNNNFNPDIKSTKQLLRAMIKEKLELLWTDSFNLVMLDDELIRLLKEAGCIRMDLGWSVVNPKLQKLYNNIVRTDEVLKNLKKIHQQGIWTDVNIIANLPHCYSVKEEIKIAKKYAPYIDAVTLNSYRAYPSDLFNNFEKYGLKKVNEQTAIHGVAAPMLFMEKEFAGSVKERKRLFVQNFLDWEDFLKKNKVIVNQKMFHLLGCLYQNYGHKNKALIKRMMLQASKQAPKFSGV